MVLGEMMMHLFKWVIILFKSVHEAAKSFYKIFHNWLAFFSNVLSLQTIPENSLRRLKVLNYSLVHTFKTKKHITMN